MTSSVAVQKTLDDFVAATGLKKQWAKECFDQFGTYDPAMASFAQSLASLPEDYFEQRSALVQNTDTINAELREIYRRARELKASTGKEDEAVWRAFDAPSPAPTAPASEAAASQPAAPSPEPTAPASEAAASQPAAPSPEPTAPASEAAAPPPPPVSPFAQIGTAAPGAFGGTSFNFGFGAAPSTSGNNAKLSSVFKEFGESKEEANSEKKPKTVKYCKPSHITGSFFSISSFWEEEVANQCPLLNLNNGFLEENKGILRKRLEKWVTKAKFYRNPVEYVEIEDEDEETIRVIIKDADRTFFHPDHRKKFVSFLCAMFYEFDSYGQAMSYLAGICLLVLDEEETASVLRLVSKEYIPKHWAAEAVGFATSAWVVEYFMQKLFPDVAQHLNNLNFWPDTYLQKILTGLCVHVLQFKELFEFLDLFMESGIKFLIKFCLAIVEHFRSDLLQIKSSVEANELYEIMRLDSKVADSQDITAILKRAPLIELGDEENNIDCIKMKMYNKHVEPRVKRAPKTEAFEPCAVCNVRKPKWWNDDLGAVCNECKEAAPELEFSKY